MSKDFFNLDAESSANPFSTITNVIGEKFVGALGLVDDKDFHASLAATVLDQGYDDFFKETNRAFDEATPSELSKVAMNILAHTKGVDFEDIANGSEVASPTSNFADKGNGGKSIV